MIVLRNKNFALPESRKGIGWVNDKNGKLDSEKYFKAVREMRLIKQRREDLVMKR